MKQKVAQLSLLFLFVGLFCSSKEIRCDGMKKDYGTYALEAAPAVAAITEKAAIAIPEENRNDSFGLAPGSYIFVY